MDIMIDSLLFIFGFFGIILVVLEIIKYIEFHKNIDKDNYDYCSRHFRNHKIWDYTHCKYCNCTCGVCNCLHKILKKLLCIWQRLQSIMKKQQCIMNTQNLQCQKPKKQLQEKLIIKAQNIIKLKLKAKKNM